jgi:hypothetical protein
VCGKKKDVRERKVERAKDRLIKQEKQIKRKRRRTSEKRD